MQTLENNIGNNRVHPHKFAMWLALGSMIMFFAGLTSAYLVHMSKGNWVYFNVPTAFWYSTIVILASSVTMWLATKAMRNRDIKKYRSYMIITTVLGLLFLAMQYQGFREMHAEHILLNGKPSESLFYIIPLAHGLHVVGGIIALIYMTLKSILSKRKDYNIVPVQIVGTYWHFVDIVWIYLFVFFILTQQLKLI